MRRSTKIFALLALSVTSSLAAQEAVPVFPGTQPMTLEGDIASLLVTGVDRFLLRQLEASIAGRSSHWNRDFSSAVDYTASVEPNRKRLGQILGVRDARVPFKELELVATTGQSAVVGKGSGYQVLAVRWPVLRDVHGEGLLLVPARRSVADVIVLPDCEQTPEMLAGLTAELPRENQTARRLAESGCRVLVPLLINRQLASRGARATLTHREFLYRSGFELGRHLIGYELQKILAIVDWFERSPGNESSRIGVFGWGEGGLLALYAAALDSRIDAACVSGYFTSRQNIWKEPIDRNVFGLLEQFGDAELASLVAPRPLFVEVAAGPELVLTSGKGGAPARLVSPEGEDVHRECERAAKLVAGLSPTWKPRVVTPAERGQFGSPEVLELLLAALSPGVELAPPADPPQHLRRAFDPATRLARQVHELDVHNQWLLSESSYVRAEFMKQLDTSSLEKYATSVAPYRDYFRNEVVGRFDQRLADPSPRTRRTYDEPSWTGYEVVLDVFPDVFAYGILCVPKGIPSGERRPVVVCQHGLEGRPQDIVTGKHRAYHDFAAKLAERGFITFAPQNLYIFGDRFRTLQRKANPLKKTLFSIIVPQHQQILNWLRALPIVDGDRIAFYGLSYGGKSAMRIPPLVTDYCLSICSADFNEWVWKNASTRSKYSYIGTGEYEIFEWDLGSTFNYAEMAALIAPRPFMVERGHFDGVAPDEAVAYEFAKVRHLYHARLGIGDRAEIEWFVGPHTIHGQGTFQFLHRHLDWPQPHE